MQTIVSASEHLESGRLQDAISAATAAVKQQPTDTARRILLAELLCIAREWERADKQIDTIGHQDPQALVGLSLIRQLIRAELSRQECFLQGRPPEFVDEPTAQIPKRLEALIALREGDQSLAAQLLLEAESLRPPVSGTCDGSSFTAFRDLDDLAAGVFEVLTSTGKYFWVPAERVQSIEFKPPKRLRDLAWRHAEMHVKDGPVGDVFLPVVYPDDPSHPSDEQLQLGRGTDWIGGDGTPVRGRGQRMFLVGDEAKTIMQMSVLTFD